MKHLTVYVWNKSDKFDFVINYPSSSEIDGFWRIILAKNLWVRTEKTIVNNDSSAW